MTSKWSPDTPWMILAQSWKLWKITIFHPKIVKISPGVEVFQVPLAKLRIEIERRKKIMIPGLWNFEIRPQGSHEISIKVEIFDPPLQVQKCQHRPHPAKLKQAQIEEECFAPWRKSASHHVFLSSFLLLVFFHFSCFFFFFLFIFFSFFSFFSKSIFLRRNSF